MNPASPLIEQSMLLAKRVGRLAFLPVALARPHFITRRIQAYCVSLGKSGTHSVAGLFRHYRVAHEAQDDDVIHYIVNHTRTDSLEQQCEYLRRRDRRLWLELESSHILFYLLDPLLTEFPQAKFILTIRDCYSWLDSILNYNLTQQLPAYWKKFALFRFGPPATDHTPQEKVLADYGAPTLNQLLRRWASHQRQVLNRIPAERLLVIRTHELRQSIPALANFLNIAPDTLDADQTHLYQTPRRLGLVAQIDPDFLAAKVAEHCGDLMQTYFPEVHSLADARRLELGEL